ncbi:ABC transporter ATP-binding protein [Leucobacter sp. 1207-22]|uniref:ABC transporter ATP-binding protein n=1 Tax=Leucobacter sp. 1207-22 TaxID=2604456 RepID=UPI0040644855
MNTQPQHTSGLMARNVTVGYTRDVDVVRNASFTVPRGEVVALLGASGSGKSTLLRAVAGLEPVRAGGISWNGVDLVEVAPHKRGFGLVFQDGQLFTHRTVAENVAYGLRVQRLPRVEREARVTELLELVGLPGTHARRVTELSGGERQRIALARSLAPQPSLLLLDEPLSALDRELRERLAADLATMLRITKTTAILVTHDEGEAEVVADRVLRVRAGAVESDTSEGLPA